MESYKKFSQLLYDDRWVQLKRVIAPSYNINGYTYSHEIRCNGHIISILPYMVKNEELWFLLRKEATPCWEFDTPVLSSITGGVDYNLTPLETVIKELKEESGFEVEESQIIKLGTSYGTKSTDTIYHLYSVDLTDIRKEHDLYVESELEKSATCVWVSQDMIFSCKDPFVSVAYVRVLQTMI